MAKKRKYTDAQLNAHARTVQKKTGNSGRLSLADYDRMIAERKKRKKRDKPQELKAPDQTKTYKTGGGFGGGKPKSDLSTARYIAPETKKRDSSKGRRTNTDTVPLGKSNRAASIAPAAKEANVLPKKSNSRSTLSPNQIGGIFAKVFGIDSRRSDGSTPKERRRRRASPSGMY